MNTQQLKLKQFKREMYWKPYKREFREITAMIRSLGTNILISGILVLGAWVLFTGTSIIFS